MPWSPRRCAPRWHRNPYGKGLPGMTVRPAAKASEMRSRMEEVPPAKAGMSSTAVLRMDMEDRDDEPAVETPWQHERLKHQGCVASERRGRLQCAPGRQNAARAKAESAEALRGKDYSGTTLL
jgi:hypothetical protein